MKNVFIALSFLVATSAIAGKTQVNQDAYRPAGKTGHYYGRSDGIYHEVNSKGLVTIENGTQAGTLGKGFYQNFANYAANEGIACYDQAGIGTCVGNAALAPCTCELGDGSSFIFMPLDTQDIVPDMDAGSLDVGCDQTNDDAVMLLWGIGGASGKPFVVGRDPAFYMCTTSSVTDITGIDQNIMAGFVAIDTGIEGTSGSGGMDVFNADFEALDAYAGIGILGTSGAGVTAEDITIKTETDAARDGTGDGVTTTDTTDDATEGVYYTYCTHVSSAGVVTYTVNGASPTATAAFTFVDGITVIPFFTAMNTAELADEIDIKSVKVGYAD